MTKGASQPTLLQNNVHRCCADMVSPKLMPDVSSKLESEPQPAMGARTVANDATVPLTCCSVNDMSTQTCQSSNPRQNRASTDEDQDCLARLVDVQQTFKELQLKVMADVETKLQEHAAHLRTLLVEEVNSQIMSRTARVAAADTDDSTAAVTCATSRAVGHVNEDGGELTKLRGPSSPNHSLQQQDACVSELQWEAPDPRAETQRRLSAIEQQLRSREREAMIPGVMGSVDRLQSTVDVLQSTASIATLAAGRKHVRDSEILMKDQPCQRQQKQHPLSVHDRLGSTFLCNDEAEANGYSEETRSPSLSPPPPSNNPCEATERSPYTKSPGSRSNKQRQTCTQRNASPELADILERRRHISEGQIAQQAYGAFMSPRSKRKP